MSRIAVTDEPLSVLVARRMEDLGITSGRQLAARCGFAKDTARHVLSGQRNSDESTLRALAEGLSLPLPMVRRAAGRPGSGCRSCCRRCSTSSTTHNGNCWCRWATPSCGSETTTERPNLSRMGPT